MKEWMSRKESQDFLPLENSLSGLSPGYKSALLVFRNEQIIPVRVTDIAYIHSSAGIVKVYNKNKQCYPITEVLDELEPQLDPQRFFRANRQYIVNRDVVSMAEYYFNRRLVLKLKVEITEQIVISKMKTPELMQWMQR
jgi:DNA-binding LytR/AlgR family response regulator